MTISMNTLKQLRSDTGAGVLDCQRALAACDGDLEQAKIWLRKEGIAKATSKEDRDTAEGLVSAAVDGRFGVMLELNCETDFVSRNERFQGFLSDILTYAIHHKISSLENLLVHGVPTVEERILEQAAILGERIRCTRLGVLEVNPGIVCSYIHGSQNVGSIGVLVALQSELSGDVLAPLGKDIALHIAAAAPQYIAISDVSSSDIAREEDIFRTQFKDRPEPAEIIEKMISSSFRKFYEETVLEEQTFVKNSKQTIKEFLRDAEKIHGKPIQVVKFLRFVLGAKA